MPNVTGTYQPYNNYNGNQATTSNGTTLTSNGGNGTAPSVTSVAPPNVPTPDGGNGGPAPPKSEPVDHSSGNYQ